IAGQVRDGHQSQNCQSARSCGSPVDPAARRRGDRMRRREFITLLGSAAASWPIAARAQQPAMLVIGFLDNSSPNPSFLARFNEGLRQAGYFDRRNVTIEFRGAEGLNERLPLLAADLVRRQVAVIATVNTPSVLAAKASTQTIPITFGVGVDPVATGLVASLNRPAGTLTGVTQLINELTAKCIELLHELVPAARSIAFVVNPTNSLYTAAETRQAQDAAGVLGVRLVVSNGASPEEIEAAFATIAQQRIGAVLVSADSL